MNTNIIPISPSPVVITVVAAHHQTQRYYHAMQHSLLVVKGRVLIHRDHSSIAVSMRFQFVSSQFHSSIPFNLIWWFLLLLVLSSDCLGVSSPFTFVAAAAPLRKLRYCIASLAISGLHRHHDDDDHIQWMRYLAELLYFTQHFLCMRQTNCATTEKDCSLQQRGIQFSMVHYKTECCFHGFSFFFFPARVLF